MKTIKYRAKKKTHLQNSCGLLKRFLTLENGEILNIVYYDREGRKIIKEYQAKIKTIYINDYKEGKQK